MKQFIQVNIILVMVILLLGLYPHLEANASGQFAADAPLVEAASREMILSTTVQISMFALSSDPELKDQIQAQAGLTEGREENDGTNLIQLDSLGTLVETQGGKVIVTHGHWGKMLEVANFAHIYDANGEFLLALNGGELKDLIRYQDKGTIVFEAPATLSSLPAASPVEADLQPADLSLETTNPEMPQAGDQVAYVHLVKGETQRLEVLSATFQSLGRFKRLEVLQILVPEGGVILGGNSGGGVWFEGRYIGNVWATEENREFNWQKLQFDYSLTHLSYIAPFNPGMVQD